MAEPEKKNDLKEPAEDAKKEDMGFYFFSDRNKPKNKENVSKTWSNLLQNPKLKLKCVTNVHDCIRTDPQVNLLINAMKAHGCPLSINRHIACERCRSSVNGGYDVEKNQIVVCENNSSSPERACSVLKHEMIHMFDYCRAKVNFLENMEHLACSEVRAASLTHCSYVSGLTNGCYSPFESAREKHQECVKQKATMSVLVVKSMEVKEAAAIVDKVFPKCYKDLEPFGRVPRRNSEDPKRMLAEGYLYGYSPRTT